MDFEATFNPQVWINDYAVEVDSLGERKWTVSGTMMDEIAKYANGDFADLFTSSDLSDILKDDLSAPDWVRNWNGPFWISVVPVEWNPDTNTFDWVSVDDALAVLNSA